MINTIKQIFLVLILGLTLSACGFHLRGSQGTSQVEVSTVFLRASNASQVANELKEQLLSSNTKITGSREEAELIVSLERESIKRRVLSVSAVTGKVEEYQLTLSVDVSVSRPGIAEALFNDVIRVSRDYTFDEDAVLGKFTEEEELQQELINHAATQIIRRLNAAARK